MAEFIKINNTVFNLAHVVTVNFDKKRLHGDYNKGFEFIPRATLTVTTLYSGADGSFSETYEFYGDDALEAQELFIRFSFAEIGGNITIEDFYSEANAKKQTEKK